MATIVKKIKSADPNQHPTLEKKYSRTIYLSERSLVVLQFVTFGYFGGDYF
jgi:hypothetical protein